MRYDQGMHPTIHAYLRSETWRSKFFRLVSSWWYLIHLAAVILVLALSPATWRAANRAATARHIYINTWQVLPWFTVLSTLVSLVLIRIVLITALSYGLSQYALEMMVRVLVLELIPLAAALFVALRSGLTFNVRASAPQQVYQAVLPTPSLISQLRHELVPQVIAGTFAVQSLAMVSSVIVLVLAYLNVYGISPWGLGEYTRTVARIFDPAVATGFALKSILFGLAVALIPGAALLEARATARQVSSGVQPGAIRLLSVLVLIEAGSLALKYI